MCVKIPHTGKLAEDISVIVKKKDNLEIKPYTS